MDSTSATEDGSIESRSDQGSPSEIPSQTTSLSVCPHCYRHVDRPPQSQSDIHPPVIPNSHATHAELQDAINSALENQLDDQQHYDVVKVLLLNWEDIFFKKSQNNLHLLEQTTNLMGVFRDTYRYDVEHYLIPSESPYFQLLKELSRILSDLAEYPGKAVLFILYYNGHSSLQNGQLMWSA
jgi:hypothetical protein